MQRLIISRRQMLLGGGVSALISAIDAFCMEPRWLQIVDHDIPIPHLPQAVEGYRIAQITDAHLRHIGLVEERIFQEIENRNVELVVLTGDIIDSLSNLDIFEEFCDRLRSKKRTILATLGNWEHWARIPITVLRDRYRAHNIRLLINENVLINSAIFVSATDDLSSGNAELDKALDGCGAAKVSLFLTHSPELLDYLPPGRDFIQCPKSIGKPRNLR